MSSYLEHLRKLLTPAPVSYGPEQYSNPLNSTPAYPMPAQQYMPGPDGAMHPASTMGDHMERADWVSRWHQDIAKAEAARMLHNYANPQEADPRTKAKK